MRGYKASSPRWRGARHHSRIQKLCPVSVVSFRGVCVSLLWVCFLLSIVSVSVARGLSNMKRILESGEILEGRRLLPPTWATSKPPICEGVKRQGRQRSRCRFSSQSVPICKSIDFYLFVPNVVSKNFQICPIQVEGQSFLKHQTFFFHFFTTQHTHARTYICKEIWFCF